MAKFDIKKVPVWAWVAGAGALAGGYVLWKRSQPEPKTEDKPKYKTVSIGEIPKPKPKAEYKKVSLGEIPKPESKEEPQGSGFSETPDIEVSMTLQYTSPGNKFKGVKFASDWDLMQTYEDKIDGQDTWVVDLNLEDEKTVAVTYYTNNMSADVDGIFFDLVKGVYRGDSLLGPAQDTIMLQLKQGTEVPLRVVRASDKGDRDPKYKHVLVRG